MVEAETTGCEDGDIIVRGRYPNLGGRARRHVHGPRRIRRTARERRSRNERCEQHAACRSHERCDPLRVRHHYLPQPKAAVTAGWSRRTELSAHHLTSSKTSAAACTCRCTCRSVRFLLVGYSPCKRSTAAARAEE